MSSHEIPVYNSVHDREQAIALADQTASNIRGLLPADVTDIGHFVRWYYDGRSPGLGHLPVQNYWLGTTEAIYGQLPPTLFHVTSGLALESLVGGKPVIPSLFHQEHGITHFQSASMDFLQRLLDYFGIETGSQDWFVWCSTRYNPHMVELVQHTSSQGVGASYELMRLFFEEPEIPNPVEDCLDPKRKAIVFSRLKPEIIELFLSLECRQPPTSSQLKLVEQIKYGLVRYTSLADGWFDLIDYTLIGKRLIPQHTASSTKNSSELRLRLEKEFEFPISGFFSPASQAVVLEVRSLQALPHAVCAFPLSNRDPRETVAVPQIALHMIERIYAYDPNQVGRALKVKLPPVLPLTTIPRERQIISAQNIPPVSQRSQATCIRTYASRSMPHVWLDRIQRGSMAPLTCLPSDEPVYCGDEIDPLVHSGWQRLMGYIADVYTTTGRSIF